MQYNIIQCNTIQYNTIPWNTIQWIMWYVTHATVFDSGPKSIYTCRGFFNNTMHVLYNVRHMFDIHSWLNDIHSMAMILIGLGKFAPGRSDKSQ